MSIYTIVPNAGEEFGGHEFNYEATTDLFRCSRCREYEVVARDRETQAITPCPGVEASGPAGPAPALRAAREGTRPADGGGEDQ